MNIKEEVYKAIIEIKTNDIEIKDDSLFKEDLGIDSIKGFKLLMLLDKKNIVFKKELPNEIKTVNDLIMALEEKHA